jgi:hypothetical protein
LLQCPFIWLAEVLTWVAGLIAQAAQKLIEGRCQERAKEWAYEVYPEVSWEMMVHSRRSKRPSKVERATGEVNACSSVSKRKTTLK